MKFERFLLAFWEVMIYHNQYPVHGESLWKPQWENICKEVIFLLSNRVPLPFQPCVVSSFTPK